MIFIIFVVGSFAARRRSHNIMNFVMLHLVFVFVQSARAQYDTNTQTLKTPTHKQKLKGFMAVVHGDAHVANILCTHTGPGAQCADV